jgi:hypothetical protein
VIIVDFINGMTTVLMDNLTHSIISGTEMDAGRPERLSSSIEVPPALNWENH